MSLHRQASPSREPSPRPRPSSIDAHAKSSEQARHARQSYAPPFHPSQAAPNPKLEPLEMPPLQARFIEDEVGKLQERAAKRRRVEMDHRNNRGHLEPTMCQSPSGGEDSVVESVGGGFDLLEELDAHPDVIHIVATAGGLITHWNESFADITRPSASLRHIPLTIFELVESSALPSLYEIFALSLHNVGVVEVEGCFRQDSAAGDEEDEKSVPPSHLSITLPCRSFRKSSVAYNITVVFMNDDESTRRCFLGILTPRPKGGASASLHGNQSFSKSLAGESSEKPKDGNRMPLGKILRVKDETLCHMLLS